MAHKSNMRYWDGYYTGDVAFFSDLPNGWGTYWEAGRDIYKGEWKGGDFHGLGTFYWRDGSYVEGTFSHGAIVRGTVVFTSGKKISGPMTGRDGHYALNGECMATEPYSSYPYPVLYDHGRFVKKL